MTRTIPPQHIERFRLAIATSKPPFPVALSLMLEAGLRVGELIHLAWSDLINENTPRPGLQLDAHMTKGSRARFVPFNHTLKALIHDAWTTRRAQHGWTLPNYILAQKPNGLPITTRTIQRKVNDMTAKLLNQPLSPHALRHTFATRLLRVSNLEAVRAALGHRHLSTTQVYLHPTDDELTTAIMAT